MKPRKLKRPQTRVDILNPGFGIPPLKRNEVQEMIRESAFPREKMMVDRIEKIESKLGMAGTEPECTCEPGWDEKCTCRGDTQAPPEPDLPLKVRVATLDGWENIRRSSDYDEIENPQWVGYRKQQGGTAFGVIPDYPNDLVAAMGALEAYCESTNSYTELTIHSGKTHGDKRYFCDINMREKPDPTDPDSGWMIGSGTSLPQAICEAIAKHAEGTK